MVWWWVAAGDCRAVMGVEGEGGAVTAKAITEDHNAKVRDTTRLPIALWHNNNYSWIILYAQEQLDQIPPPETAGVHLPTVMINHPTVVMCPLAFVATAAEGAGEATGDTPWRGTWALIARPSSHHSVGLTVTVEWR